MSEDRKIEAPPAGVAGWREVWTRRLGYGTTAGPVGALRRILRRLLGPDLDLQRDFNLAALEMLEGLQGDVLDLREDLAALRDRHDEKLSAGIQRNDALITVLDQKIEGALARIRDLATPIISTPGAASFRDDYLYRRFEDAARGSAEHVRTSMEPVIERLRGHEPVLDVGCGRGELLQLCREAGIACRGIDVNERSIAELREAGYDANVGAIPDALDALEPASVGAVYASHVVEHLQTSSLLALFTSAHRVLREGGILIIETPNAETLMVSGVEFWKDPSHIAPRHVASLVILAREVGFAVVESTTIHPFDESRWIALHGSPSAELTDLVDQLNRILFGNQDLRLVLQK